MTGYGNIVNNQLIVNKILHRQQNDHKLASVLDKTRGNFKINIVPVTVTISSSNALKAQRTDIAVIDGPSFISIAAAKDPIFTNNISSKKFFEYMSNNDFTLMGRDSINGDFTAANITVAPGGNCNQRMISEFTPMVRQQLINVGRNPNSYGATVLIFDDNVYFQLGCPFNAYGTLGIPRDPHPSGMVWILKLGYLGNFTAINHEMGHILGLMHSRSANLSTGVFFEYGDSACTMGGNFKIFNSAQLRILGWGGEYTEITNFQNYNLFPLSSRSKRAKMINGLQASYVVARNLSGNPNGLLIYPQCLYEQFAI